MGAIWVIEKIHDRILDAADALMGDFPVRKIASIYSFSCLIRIKHTQRPSALVIDARDSDFSIEHAEKAILDCLPNCPRIYLVMEPQTYKIDASPVSLGFSFYLVTDTTCNLSFSKHIQAFLPQKLMAPVKNNNLLIYRDLRLDMNFFQLQIVPQEKVEVLPLKEARLLRYFMENTGKCLSRAEIQRAVWDGVKIESRTVDSHISRLRKRIGAGEVTIESFYGDGYQMT